MSKADKSRRSFLKTIATTAGFVAAAGYLRKLLPTRADSIQAINDHNAITEHKQKQAWLHIQWQPMSASEKKQMLDDLIDSHNEYQT
jgi:hypothetical protein